MLLLNLTSKICLVYFTNIYIWYISHLTGLQFFLTLPIDIIIESFRMIGFQNLETEGNLTPSSSLSEP